MLCILLVSISSKINKSSFSVCHSPSLHPLPPSKTQHALVFGLTKKRVARLPPVWVVSSISSENRLVSPALLFEGIHTVWFCTATPESYLGSQCWWGCREMETISMDKFASVETAQGPMLDHWLCHSPNPTVPWEIWTQAHVLWKKTKDLNSKLPVPYIVIHVGVLHPLCNLTHTGPSWNVVDLYEVYLSSSTLKLVCGLHFLIPLLLFMNANWIVGHEIWWKLSISC